MRRGEERRGGVGGDIRERKGKRTGKEMEEEEEGRRKGN